MIANALSLPIGFFIGLFKGQEARTRFLKKTKRTKKVKLVDDVLVEDYEMQAFHN
jgi:hypothetical protein